MRLLLGLPLVLALAGCVQPGVAAPLLRAEAFDTATPALFLVLGGGCGFCPGQSGFDKTSESFVIAVMDDGRVVRADVNGGWGADGGLHVEPNITFDPEHLLRLVSPSDRARGETWVLRVLTARLIDEGEPARLAAMWRDDAEDQRCEDTGYDLSLHHPDGSLAHATFSCGPRDGPMRELSDELFRIARAMPGNATRQGAAGENMWG